jgi:hypothetical protein
MLDLVEETLEEIARSIKIRVKALAIALQPATARHGVSNPPLSGHSGHRRICRWLDPVENGPERTILSSIDPGPLRP